MPWKDICVMEEKMRFVLVHDVGEVSMSELCRQYEVSRKTGYKWLGRYAASGVAGLSELSRSPRHHRHALTAAVEELVLSVRGWHPTWGPRKVRAWLLRHHGQVRVPAASTIGALFDREGLTVRRKRRHRAPPRTAPFATCQAANDLWCVDLKGWFRTGDGRRCEPLTMSDAASRYLLRCQAMEHTDTETAWPVFDAAFREFGLPLALRSDNGPPFASVAAGGLSPLAVRLVKAGVTPERTDPASPQQNGRLERLHLTLKQDTASPPAKTLRQQKQRFRSFQRCYNEERPHEALEQTPPSDHYAASPRRYSGRLREPDYADDDAVRRVRHSGEIKWRGAEVYVSQTLAGEPVGLVQVEDGQWTVRFGPVILGRIDHQGRFIKPKRKRRKPPVDKWKAATRLPTSPQDQQPQQ